MKLYHINDIHDGNLVSQEPLNLAWLGELLLDLLGAGQVVMYGGGLDGSAPLHHQPGRPLALTGVLVRVITAPVNGVLDAC